MAATTAVASAVAMVGVNVAATADANGVDTSQAGAAAAPTRIERTSSPTGQAAARSAGVGATGLSPVSLAGHEYPGFPDWHRLPELDRQLLIQLSRLRQVFAAPGNADHIWDHSYRPDQTSMLFAPATPAGDPPQHAYLTGHPKPSAAGNAQRLKLPPALGLPDVFRLTRGTALTEIAEVTSTDSALVAGTRTTLFRYQRYPGKLELEPITPDVTIAAAVIAHEAFHFSYQHQRWHIADEPDVSSASVADAAWNALALVEHRLLMRPVNTSAQARETLRSVAAIRRTRMAAHRAEVAGESAREWLEGPARSVDVRVAQLQGFRPIGDDSIPPEPQDLYVFLLVGRAYTGGARLVDLLDKAYGRSWRTDCPEKSLTDIMLSRVGPLSDRDRQARVAAAKKTHDYNHLLATVKKANLPAVHKEFS